MERKNTSTDRIFKLIFNKTMVPLSNKGDDSLTTGSLWVSIQRISWPMLLIMVFQFMVGLTDVYVAGLISAEVQAAVGFISQLYFFLIILGNAISIGTVSLVSRAVGAGNIPRALHFAKQSLLAGVFISALLTIIMVLFYREIAKWAGFPEEIRPVAEIFLRFFAVALIPNYFVIISSAFFRASGSVTTPLITMMVFCAVNIIGDFGFVFGLFSLPELGFSGIAVATALGAVSAMCSNLLFLAAKKWRAIYSKGWIPKWAMIKIIAALGWPAAMLQIAWNAGSLVLYNMLGRLGESNIAVLAALTNGLRIEAIIFLPAFAFNMAASVLVGQNLGAGKPDRAETIGWRISRAAMIFVTVMATAVFIWAEYWAELLTEDPAVMKETVFYLRINMFSEPFMAMSLVLAGGLQGAGDTRGNMWIIIIAMWLVRLPLAACLVFWVNLGATGAWIAMVISMIIQGILMALRFKKGNWKNSAVE
ncbi:MAG: MATE family efflux transporter [Syntrophales bacterium]|jgi:putative MATE family efflux protein|nr:MATE family efflux transporter [Syntrophales bacterium]MDY0043590.1 MATE family efflux transporter [Syntrophales bacterium]